MTLRILADENVDYRVVHRLANYGHDVEHVDLVPELGKGSTDEAVARHAVETDRLLLTSDDDSSASSTTPSTRASSSSRTTRSPPRPWRTPSTR